jgi:hypothetical protein
MKRLLVAFVVLVAGIVGLGFYLGWFQFSTGGTDEKPNITLTVDKDKFDKDKKKAEEEVKKAGQTVKEKIGGGTEKSKDEGSRP